MSATTIQLLRIVQFSHLDLVMSQSLHGRVNKTYDLAQPFAQSMNRKKNIITAERLSDAAARASKAALRVVCEMLELVNEPKVRLTCTFKGPIREDRPCLARVCTWLLVSM